MKQLLFSLFILYSLFCSAQTFQKAQEESAVDFIKKNVPDGLTFTDALTSQVIATDWNAVPSIFGFYLRTYKLPGDDEGYEDVIGYVYRQTGNDTYERILIDTFENEGGTAGITAVFFANADKDTARELVILTHRDAHHHDVDGQLYETRIYDNILPGQHTRKLTYLQNASQKVSGGFDGYREGENVHSKFKTAKEVRAGLKQAGY